MVAQPSEGNGVTKPARIIPGHHLNVKTSSASNRTSIITSSTTVQFSGPMPPPELLERYEQICPGSADRMLGLVEGEAKYRREMESAIVHSEIDRTRKSFAEAKRGQICAVIITLSTLIAGVYAAVTGHEVSGSIIGSAGIGGIVTTFILGRAKHKPEEKLVSEPDQEPSSRSNRTK